MPATSFSDSTNDCGIETGPGDGTLCDGMECRMAASGCNFPTRGAWDWRFAPYTAPMIQASHSTPGQEGDHGVLLEVERPRLGPPRLYRVLLLNDDYTPMDFVVDVLQHFFGMNLEQATQVMLHVHTRGKGVCGVYSREVAETKVSQVNEYSRNHQHPLLCTMEQV